MREVAKWSACVQSSYEELDYIENGGDTIQTYPLLATMEDKEKVVKLRQHRLDIVNWILWRWLKY